MRVVGYFFNGDFAISGIPYPNFAIVTPRSDLVRFVRIVIQVTDHGCVRLLDAKRLTEWRTARNLYSEIIHVRLRKNPLERTSSIANPIL